ncbi:hypothetical protein BT69DRAFT_1315936 [Atractiella rhizophila]|nr:hypothetical protein BT69DRAFT_1315936 [Atractiella rhizophila]
MSIISIPSDHTHHTYTLCTSEDLGARSVKVKRRGSGKNERGWIKTRELVEDEIVSSVIDEESSLALWTIHRPIRGWYLRLRRSQSLLSSAPPSNTNSYIALSPSRQQPTSLSFTISSSSQTNQTSLHGHSKSLSLTSSLSPLPLSPNPSLPIQRHVSSSPSTPLQNPTSTFSPPQNPTILVNGKEKRTRSFMLSPETAEPQEVYKTFNPLRVVRDLWNWKEKEKGLSFVIMEEGRIIGRFEDRPKLWSTTTEGTLFLEVPAIESLGAAGRETEEESMWIAVCMAYLEFLEDRDAYHAASEG